MKLKIEGTQRTHKQERLKLTSNWALNASAVPGLGGGLKCGEGIRGLRKGPSFVVGELILLILLIPFEISIGISVLIIF